MRQVQSKREFPARVQRRGISIVLVGIVLVALIAFVSLAVDIGRMRLANAEMQTAADAAARSGALALATRADTPNTNQDVINEAFTAAIANPAIGAGAPDKNGNARVDSGVVLSPNQDIDFGNWNPGTRKFTVIPATGNRRAANAVRVRTVRSVARGNALKLIFAPVLGIYTSDVGRYATAYITGGSGNNFGFIGLQWVHSNGNPGSTYGGVASDGNIDLGNGDVLSNSTVVGDARPGIGASLLQKNNSQVDGWTANLDYALTPLYPPIMSPPAGAITFPTSTTITLTGGSTAATRVNYTGAFPFHGNTQDDVVLNVSGYVRIYLTTDLWLSKVTVNWTNPSTPSADRLEYYLTGTKCTDVYGNGNVVTYAHVYAPQCNVAIGGTRDFYGWAIGKTLSFEGTSHFYYDGTQNQHPELKYKIHLVQ